MKYFLFIGFLIICPIRGMENASPSNNVWKRYSPEEYTTTKSSSDDEHDKVITNSPINKNLEKVKNIHKNIYNNTLKESQSIEITTPLPIPVTLKAVHNRKAHISSELSKKPVTLEDINIKTTILFDLLSDKIHDLHKEIDRLDVEIIKLDQKIYGKK